MKNNVFRNRLKNGIRHGYARLYSSYTIQSIQESLVMIFPVIMIGAFALVFRSFPVAGYQAFIQTFAGGVIDSFLQYLHSVTFQLLSIYMVVSLSFCYINKMGTSGGNHLGAIFSSLLTFGMFSGILSDTFTFDQAFGVNALFTAVVSALAASSLYRLLLKKIHLNLHFFTSGAGDNYHDMLKHIIPVFVIGAGAAMLNLCFHLLLGVDSLQEIYVLALNKLFSSVGVNFKSAFLYVFMVHLLWFFGIHGGNSLEAVTTGVFEPAFAANEAAVQTGAVPTEIFSKPFFDIFVLMGGCGSTLCLLLAILLFEKGRGIRNLSKFAVIPSIFNINELIVFGIPIVFNPIMLIPFFLTPITNLILSTAAMKLHLVPLVTHSVEWTTPIFLGGFYATGSVAGGILQIINLCVGAMIYRPFIRLMDRETEKNTKEHIRHLADILNRSEETRMPVSLLNLRGDAGNTAKILGDELEYDFLAKRPPMYYQPQYDEKNQCMGAEALLRWEHPLYGTIYPPLTIKLLEELGLLTQAEIHILRTVFEDMDNIKAVWGESVKISVNVTGSTIPSNDYEASLQELADTYPMHVHNIMLEITEQASMQIDTELTERLMRIKEMGYRLGIDDFSMGNTSVKYLKTNIFDLIKLDGSLIQDMTNNKRSVGIIKTLVTMAEEFQIQILAEYVETEEQRNMLEQLGCHMYQGHLYSPAVSLEQFLTLS